ncbi:hypothetical protein, partial [Endozoicomonas sp. SESOKO2]|uniref:hypothetical protein n=1 Tax=Endozoicomonas sp. SESOKO2 TaxID=2828743 RepID=UPI0021493A82
IIRTFISSFVSKLSPTEVGTISRMYRGVFIFAGLGQGTLFTLFVLLAVYTILGAGHAPLQKFEDSIRETDQE